MRKSHVFVGSSHPELGQLICERLGVQPGKCTLKKFANGETSVEIGVSVRDEDVYIVQSGSKTINDHIMEMLILISGCRGGSANKITAVLPMFPYSKQSKMKKHRGAVTARMLANLLIMAGADHVITMDLHATQMQGFFTKPVDNLYAGPTLARWIRLNIPNYSQAVVVSKNPGGTKRVTALADGLKVNFAMIHTDRRRSKNLPIVSRQVSDDEDPNQGSSRLPAQTLGFGPNLRSGPGPADPDNGLSSDEEDSSSNAHSIQVARVVQGHVVDDDYPESDNGLELASEDGRFKLPTDHALGGSVHAALSDDEEDEDFFQWEKVITLVGDVRDRPAIIVDDMIDRPGSFIAAAEHCYLNCGASSVHVVATHGVFTGDSLDALAKCPYINQIVVTNTFPIARELVEKYRDKLIIIDISSIFSECIRRNHHGESISVLFDELTYQ